MIIIYPKLTQSISFLFRLHHFKHCQEVVHEALKSFGRVFHDHYPINSFQHLPFYNTL